MSPFDALTMTVATARLAALASQDEITQPLRNIVDRWAKDAEYGSFRDRVSYLVNCKRCTSVWAAALVIVLWTRPAGRQIVRGLAFSQGAIALLDLLAAIED